MCTLNCKQTHFTYQTNRTLVKTEDMTIRAEEKTSQKIRSDLWVAVRGEREHWVHSNCSPTHQWVWSLNEQYCDQVCLFAFVLLSLEGPVHLSASPGRHESLHCGWDTVAAPVADVGGRKPIGRSPLFAVLNSGCAWKKMITGHVSSLQQLSARATDWLTGITVWR